MNDCFRVIAVDFDGTLCKDKFPEIGIANKNLIEWLKKEQKSGTRVILWTCRCGKRLDEAVKWCLDQGLIFDAINDNLPGVVAAMGGSNSRKVYADIYIDDKAQLPLDLPFPFDLPSKEWKNNE